MADRRKKITVEISHSGTKFVMRGDDCLGRICRTNKQLGSVWYFSPDTSFYADELRQIANELDKLNGAKDE